MSETKLHSEEQVPMQGHINLGKVLTRTFNSLIVSVDQGQIQLTVFSVDRSPYFVPGIKPQGYKYADQKQAKPISHIADYGQSLIAII